jgi:hypothetical protein
VVEFSYRDADGKRSHRKVDVISVFTLGSQSYLHGDCRLRGAQRFFRLERIVGDLVDVQTGEVMAQGAACSKTGTAVSKRGANRTQSRRR